MADWKVTVPINLPLNTITAIQNGEGIEAALSELAISGLEGHAVVHNVARAIIDTVNGSAYRITSNSETTMPPATYAHSTSMPAEGYEAYDSLSMPKSSVCSERVPSQEGSIIEEGGWCPPGKINIFIRSNTIDHEFRVGPNVTIGSIFDLYIGQQTVTGDFSGLRSGDWGWDAGCFDMSATVKEAGLKDGDVLFPVENTRNRVVVTFKDAMLRTQIVDTNDLALVETLLLSYADDTGHDFGSLIFVVNGGWELMEPDHTLTLRDCGIKNGDMITVRPREEEPRNINIVVQNEWSQQQNLTIREDAQISTLRSQYETLTGSTPGEDRFYFHGQVLIDEQQLHAVGVREGSCIDTHRTLPPLPLPKPGFAASSCSPTSPNLFAPSRLLSKSYVPKASYSGWDYTPCPRSTKWTEWN
ncbi:hypothetical protein KC345_g6096 [Hortaea werneckii]|nr:hypothetical protein KC345_g6096 [Hortaea werneckii]